MRRSITRIARPRTITDAQALALARTCIVEHGPGVSLATLAKVVGLSADAAVGAAEARGFLSWVGPQLVDDLSTEQWAVRLAKLCLRHGP